MKLNKSGSFANTDNLIVIGEKDSDFSAIISNREELKFLKKRIGSDKSRILFNHLNRLVMIYILKPDGSEAKQMESIRNAAHKFHQAIESHELEEVKVISLNNKPSEVLAMAEGLALSSYRFIKYFTDSEKKKEKLKEIGLVSEKITKKEMDRLNAVVKAVYKSRDLVNEPLSYLNATRLASEFEALGKEAGFSVEVLTRKKIESLKMGGLLAVNRGSIDPPTFTIMEYSPSKPVNKKPYVLVGKGVVYDTGGLSLKPTTDSMDYMKCDMSGAAAVGCALYALALAKVPVHVIGLVPATDNRPDGNAYVPGDVISMYDGTTVEVLNTDAEGRLILADALAWAKQYEPQLVINLATLTGAAHAAIGDEGMVGMGNAPREMMEKLIESGFRVHERIAEFPFWDEYKDMLKSDIADLKNIGGKYAGAITAGKFLEHFTSYPFIHLDIAGPAFSKKRSSYRGIGGSGVGVRLLFDFFSQMVK